MFGQALVEPQSWDIVDSQLGQAILAESGGLPTGKKRKRQDAEEEVDADGGQEADANKSEETTVRDAD